ncbi:hypothetical protein M8320_00240, partial [Leclercia sp. H6W5]|uniref:hypothetical protein n=1 Tax=Leclercia tamurae TaxID=2926467 RepID=UPI0021D1EDC3
LNQVAAERQLTWTGPLLVLTQRPSSRSSVRAKTVAWGEAALAGNLALEAAVGGEDDEAFIFGAEGDRAIAQAEGGKELGARENGVGAGAPGRERAVGGEAKETALGDTDDELASAGGAGDHEAARRGRSKDGIAAEWLPRVVGEFVESLAAT